jgi:hypothetical protein
MQIYALLKDGWSSRPISMDVPVLNHPFLPVPYVDSRWARPYVFHDISKYPPAELRDVQNDFKTLVDNANSSTKSSQIEKFKDGLLKTVDAHITRCGRVLFCDLLMYVDCLAYLCYASDLMTEGQINSNYASWVKFVVDNRRNSVMSSTFVGPKSYTGSENESDLNSCLY